MAPQDKTAHKEAMADDASAALKIKEYERACPPRGHGKKRGSYDHVGFMKEYKASTYQQNFARVKRMDFIEFSVLKANERKWDGGRATKEWKLLEAKKTPETSDMLGQEKNFELRLDVVVGEFRDVGTLEEENKACLREGRAG